MSDSPGIDLLGNLRFRNAVPFSSSQPEWNDSGEIRASKQKKMKCAIINDDDEAQFLSSTERRNTIAKYKYSYSLHATLDKVSIPSPRFFLASLFTRSFLSAHFFKKENNLERSLMATRFRFLDRFDPRCRVCVIVLGFVPYAGKKNSIFE